jgi:hypothetical protein
VGAVVVVTMNTVVAVGTAAAVGAGTVGPTAIKHLVQFEFERWAPLFRCVRLGLWCAVGGVGRADAANVLTRVVGAVEALGTAGAMSSFRVGAIFALPPVVGAIVAVCALGCRMSVPSCNGRRVGGLGRTVGAGVVMRTAEAGTSFRVGAIFALSPVVGAIVAVAVRPWESEEWA